MADHSQGFEPWLADRLGHFNADGEVFSSYIFGILDGEETSEEKEENLCDLLEGLGLDDGSPDPCQRIQKEIWTKWNNLGSKSSEEPIQQETALPKPGLGAALAAHAETQTQAYKATAKGSVKTPSECKDREAVKAAILAQYGASVVEESEEEESDEGDDDLGSNANKDAVHKAQLENRERCKEASKAKKDKDKEDREKQKKDGEDRKKKAQDKSAKVERKR